MENFPQNVEVWVFLMQRHAIMDTDQDSQWSILVEGAKLFSDLSQNWVFKVIPTCHISCIPNFN